MRHQGAQLAEGTDPPAAPFEDEVRGILRHAGCGCSFLDGDLRRLTPGVDPLDQAVWIHARHLGAVFCGLQAKSQIVTIPAGRARGYVGGMPFDPEKIRRAARRIMREKGLKMSTWSARAGKGERTFAAFLHGSTRSPTVETVYLYAEAAGVEPAELLGIEPVASISTGAFRAMMALLERVEREQACSGEALQSIRELAAAIASELRPER